MRLESRTVHPVMKITFICAVFPPEPEPAGVMARQLAERLTADGHVVSMIVPVPSRPSGVVYDGFANRFLLTEPSPSGYRVIRCPHTLLGAQRGMIRRVLENITFGISSAGAAWRLGKPDVLIVETWPLFAVQFAALLARWWDIPFVYYVQDVYPEAAEQAGYIREEGWVARILRRWDRHLCRQSARVIAISSRMSSSLSNSRGISPERIALIPNWQDEEEFKDEVVTRKWRREQGIPYDAFVAMFAGTMGHVSGVGFLVEVADLLRNDKNILIVCVGEGIHKAPMQERAHALKLENIRFLPFQPRPRVVEMQRSADLMLLTMQPAVGDTSVPSKLISYLAAGRPVVCAADAATTVASIVQQSKSGVVVRPGDAAAVAAEIRGLASRPMELEEMGDCARRHFEQNMTLNHAHAQFVRMLNQIAAQKLPDTLVQANG